MDRPVTDLLAGGIAREVVLPDRHVPGDVTTPDDPIARHSVLGIRVSALDYGQAVACVTAAAHERTPLAITALAVHGVMCGVFDRVQRYRLNAFDIVCPDGQPVRWALNLLHNAGLADRVYGPELTLRLCEAAARERLPVYFYGSTPEVLERLCRNMSEQFPGLEIAGSRPSLFRHSTDTEQAEIIDDIRRSGARLVFVGLGCPRQEVWAFENASRLSLPTLAVGAAFDYHAGTLPRPPATLQRAGLEWAYRLWREPTRLWRRYLLLNPAYLLLLAAQILRLHRFDTGGEAPARSENHA